MHFNKLTRKTEPEPSPPSLSLIRRVSLCERLEDPSLVFPGDPTSVVLDLNTNHPVLIISQDTDFDRLTSLREFRGV